MQKNQPYRSNELGYIRFFGIHELNGVTYQETGQSAINLQRGRRRVQWMINVVGNICCETPIITTILE